MKGGGRGEGKLSCPSNKKQDLNLHAPDENTYLPIPCRLPSSYCPKYISPSISGSEQTMTTVKQHIKNYDIIIL